MAHVFVAGEEVTADKLNDLSRAKGIIGNTAIGTSSSQNQTGAITNSITFTAEADRAYAVHVLTPVLDNDGTGAQTAIITIRWAAGASVAISDALIAKAIDNMPGATSSSTAGSAAETISLVGLLNDPAAGQTTVGVGLQMSSATTTGRFLASGTTGPNANGVFYVEDIGPAI